MANKAKDLASGTLSSSTSASSTSISVSCGSGSDLALLGVWPTPPFYITVMPANPSASVPNSLDSEIMKVSTLIVNDGIVEMAVSRGQRGTTAKAFSAGDIVSHAVYAEDAVLLGEEGSAETPSPWVGTDEIEDEAITTDKIATGAVNGNKVADYSIPSTKLERTTLYWNNSGYFGSDDITLADSVANYRFIEIYSKENGGRWLYNKIALPEVGQRFIVGGLFIGSSNTILYYRTRTYEITANTTITPTSDNAQIEMKPSGTTIATNTNAVGIRQIIGYK